MGSSIRMSSISARRSESDVTYEFAMLSVRCELGRAVRACPAAHWQSAARASPAR